MASFHSIITSGAEELGQRLKPHHVQLFEDFLDLLLTWNARMNLTAIRHPEEIAVKHFLDSLTLLSFISDWKKSAKIIDVGTGAGFPGIPLAILCPDLHFTLLDATRKKVEFLESAVTQLKLSNAHPRWGRAEEVNEKFDGVMARALRDLFATIHITVRLAKPRGSIFLMRGPRDDVLQIEAEKILEKHGWHEVRLVHLTLPQTRDRRTIWILQKDKT